MNGVDSLTSWAAGDVHRFLLSSRMGVAALWFIKSQYQAVSQFHKQPIPCSNHNTSREAGNQISSSTEL